MLFGMIVQGVDFIMLLSDWFLERQEKRIQTARKEGYAEGYAEAKAKNSKAVEESPNSASKSSDPPPKPSKKS